MFSPCKFLGVLVQKVEYSMISEEVLLIFM
jgi:hypothetical protein